MEKNQSIVNSNVNTDVQIDMMDDVTYKDANDNESIFKTRRQTNRDILKSRMEKKLRILSHRIDQMETVILDSGKTEFIELPKNKTIIIKIHTVIKLQTSMKVFITAISRDTDSGGLIYYLREFQDGDTCLMVIVENMKEKRTIKLNYMITK